MDDRSFDRLARLLGGASDRRTGLKALVGSLLGAGSLAALDQDADARRRRKDKDHDGADAGAERRKKKKRKCNPPCAAGQACVKGACTCASGITCGEACCAGGQTCENGACADAPDPMTCIAAGQPCKGVGLPCCDGRTCSSGQGGMTDVACYRPVGGACATTADCVYFAVCQDGACIDNTPPGCGPATCPDGCCQDGQCRAGTASDACGIGGAPCAACPDATTICAPYSAGSGGPAGRYCLLPDGADCSGNGTCVSNVCSATCQACKVDYFETKVAYADRFPVTGLAQADWVAVAPEIGDGTGGYAWVTGANNDGKLARVRLSDRSITVTVFGNQYYALSGIATTADGSLVLVGEQDGWGVYRVDPATAGPYGGTPTYWIQWSDYQSPRGLLYEGTAASGTLWIATARANGQSRSDILKYTVTNSAAGGSPAAVFQAVCGDGAIARQIGRRAGDSSHLYITCDKDPDGENKVVVIDATTGAVVKQIPVAGRPWGLAFIGDLMYVSSLNGAIFPFRLSGSGASMRVAPQCSLVYRNDPVPQGMALDTVSGEVWLATYGDGNTPRVSTMLTVTKFEVCPGTATDGVCGS